jgi:hypothetical protein
VSKDVGDLVMAVRKLLFRTEDGAPFIGDVIEYENEFWLVPEWLEGPTKGTLCPARIICLSGLPTENPEPPYKADWALKNPLQKDVLYGRQLSRMPRVIPLPDVFLRVDTDFHRG